MSINVAQHSSKPDVVILDAYKSMDENFIAAKDICVKLREMSRKTRACCDTLERVIDASMDFQAVSKNFAEKAFVTTETMGSDGQNVPDEGTYSDGFTRFMGDNIDQACKLYERSLDEICSQIEEISLIQTDMDDVFSDLEGCGEEYQEAIRLMMRHLSQNQDEVQDIAG